MANQNFNPGDVDAAVNLIADAANFLTMALQAKGYPNGEVFGSRYGFAVYPQGMGARNIGSGLKYAEAAAKIDDLKSLVKWSPELIEATLYAVEAA